MHVHVCIYMSACVCMQACVSMCAYIMQVCVSMCTCVRVCACGCECVDWNTCFPTHQSSLEEHGLTRAVCVFCQTLQRRQDVSPVTELRGFSVAFRHGVQALSCGIRQSRHSERYSLPVNSSPSSVTLHHTGQSESINMFTMQGLGILLDIVLNWVLPSLYWKIKPTTKPPQPKINNVHIH